MIKNFFDGLQSFLGSRAGQMAVAFAIYLTSIGMIKTGPMDVGEKIAFMAIGSILQSMVSGGHPPDKDSNG